MRIAKALEYGASRVQYWQEDVTHIIVDKDIQYKDVLSFLKIPSIPVNVLLQQRFVVFTDFFRRMPQLSMSCTPQSV